MWRGRRAGRGDWVGRGYVEKKGKWSQIELARGWKIGQGGGRRGGTTRYV